MYCGMQPNEPGIDKALGTQLMPTKITNDMACCCCIVLAGPIATGHEGAAPGSAGEDRPGDEPRDDRGSLQDDFGPSTSNSATPGSGRASLARACKRGRGTTHCEHTCDIQHNDQAEGVEHRTAARPGPNDEAEFHAHLLKFLRSPQGYESLDMPGPPCEVQHSSLTDWLQGIKIVYNSESADM